VIVIPFFIVVKTLGLLDTSLGLILAHTTFMLPFAALIMRDIFRDVPPEIEEAARIDGSSTPRVFFSIALPLSTPGLIATGIIIFSLSWNELLFALALTYRRATTMPLLISACGGYWGIDFTNIAIRSLICISLPTIAVLFVQRYLVRGLTLGAIK